MHGSSDKSCKGLLMPGYRFHDGYSADEKMPCREERKSLGPWRETGPLHSLHHGPVPVFPQIGSLRLPSAAPGWKTASSTPQLYPRYDLRAVKAHQQTCLQYEL